MEKYRISYKDQKVISITEETENSVTYYPNIDGVIVEPLDSAIQILSAQGIDIGFFWRGGYSNHITPFRTKIDISNCPLDDSITRKVFVHETNTRYSEKRTRFNVIVRHYKDGQYINPSIDPDFAYDDIFVTRILDNNETITIDGVQWGEWDYMWHLVVNDIATQPYLEDQRITIMDSIGVFGSQIYD